KVLQSRNHTIIYSAAENKEAYNEPYKFKFASLGKTFDDEDFVRGNLRELFSKRQKVSGDKIFASFVHILPISYDAVYPRLSKVVEQERPDLLVCDFSHPRAVMWQI
ncbi:hypothetical protein L0F63_000596, partial [Massospora cicadina]